MKIYFLTFILSAMAGSWQNASQDGIVYLSFDNGKTWENKSTGIPKDIFLSDMAMEGDLLGLSTKKHGIFLFDFQTNQWSPTPAVPGVDDEVNVLFFYNGRIFTGTMNNGVFVSSNKGGTWEPFSKGLKNLTIRKFAVIKNSLYVGTDGGLFVFDETTRSWKHVFGHERLQVNGMTGFEDEIYIGTNEGAFKRKSKTGEWLQIMSDHALHNIASDSRNLYALTYNELFISSDEGISWRSDQSGIPSGKYSFHVTEKDETDFVGQWDGVYARKGVDRWKLVSGLPKNFAATELVVSGEAIVAGSSLWPK
jgi:ligand-binding sensor domain-containing protein